MENNEKIIDNLADFMSTEHELREAVIEDRKKLASMWTNKGTPYRVRVKKRSSSNGKTVYFSMDSGMTYSSRQLCTWDELSNKQKLNAIRSEYHMRLEDIEWAIAKDPGLEENRQGWIEMAVTRFGQCCRELKPYREDE